jgi:tetratricopeptide (TPR) repeat protein
MLLLLSVATWLAAANPHLEKGRALYESQRYERAAEELKQATQVAEMSSAERIASHDLLARSLAALQRMDEVKAVYRELLRLEPNAPTPRDAAPKIRDAFQQAKEELYLEARAEDGHVLARLGSPEQPLVFRAVPRPGLPSASEDSPAGEAQASQGHGAAWGGWALAGASVVAAGVGTLLAVQASQDSSAADQAPWASETRELDSRARRKALQSHFLIGGALVGGAGAVVLLKTF